MIDETRQQIITDIDRFIARRLFQPGSSDLSEQRGLLFTQLTEAKYLLMNGDNLPPLLVLEIFLYCHSEGLPPLPFVLDWLAQGALIFHQSEGQENFERGLGFTKGRGAHSGQGHEFKKARREQVVNRATLFTWIRMLNVFGGFTVDRAVGIVHEIHSQQLQKSLRKKKPLSVSELHKEYREWKHKEWDEDTTELFRESWIKYRSEWGELIDKLEEDV